MKPVRAASLFTRFAPWTARITGHPTTFVAAVLLLVGWGLSGAIFHFSDTWQLVINTATSLATVLMVFLIQNTENRDTAAIQIKLDELIRAIDGAHNALLNLEELDDQEIARIRSNYGRLATEARQELQRGQNDTRVRRVET